MSDIKDTQFLEAAQRTEPNSPEIVPSVVASIPETILDVVEEKPKDNTGRIDPVPDVIKQAETKPGFDDYSTKRRFYGNSAEGTLPELDPQNGSSWYSLIVEKTHGVLPQ